MLNLESSEPLTQVASHMLTILSLTYVNMLCRHSEFKENKLSEIKRFSLSHDISLKFGVHIEFR